MLRQESCLHILGYLGVFGIMFSELHFSVNVLSFERQCKKKLSLRADFSICLWDDTEDIVYSLYISRSLKH